MSRAVAVVIKDQNNNPVEGVNTILAPGFDGFTNKDGYLVWGFVPDTLHNVTVLFSKAGYANKSEAHTIPSGNYDLHLVLPKTGVIPDNGELHLEIVNSDFVNKDKRPMCLPAINQAIAYRMWLDGRKIELDALVQESRDYGFNWWSVYLQGSKLQNTIFDLNPNEPNYRPQLRPFADYLNQGGIGLHAVIGVDNQDVKSPYSHWTEVDDELSGSVYIFDGGNEYDKNGFDPQLIPAPRLGTVWSRGSATADKLVPQNGAPCASFHQRTDYPATITDAVASPIYMWEHGYTVVMCTEPTRFNLDGTNKSNQPNSPRFAYQLGSIYGAMWDLACFFNQAGQRGMLFTPPLRDSAHEWIRGLND